MKKIELNELHHMQDKLYKGTVSCIDNSNNENTIKFEDKENLIVQGGRLFNLLKSFNKLPSEVVSLNTVNPLNDIITSYEDLDNSAVFLWSLGRGGASNSPTPTPLPPTGGPIRKASATDTELYTPLAFTVNPSFDLINERSYMLDSLGNARWKIINFANDNVIFDASSNLMYINTELQLEADEISTRGTVDSFINEIGLYVAVLGENNVITKYTLFSRLVFPTEYLVNQKRLKFIYKVFS